MMINGAHVILFSDDADGDRAFLRDVVGLRNVDAGGGWLIFKLPPAEVAVHPTEQAPKYELYLMCDDVEVLVAELRAKGVGVSAISEERWGRLVEVTLPSGAILPMYEPRHETAHNL